jgi:hypothetical protein
MKRNTFILLVIVLFVVGATWYVFKISTGKVKSLEELETAAALNSAELIAAFEKDTAGANTLYLGKVLEVTGPVKSVEKEEGAATVILGTKNTLSSVRCSMDSGYVKKALQLNPGSMVTVKGACTGYNADEMGLGSDVVLNRCIILSIKK